MRPYQEQASAACDEWHNTLIVLPTGSGKTRIAADRIRKNGTPCIFIVPQIVLVEQQANALRKDLGPTFTIGKLSSSHVLETECDVLVATPDKFLNEFGIDDQHRRPELDLFMKIRLIIFDETHHVRGDHPYAKIIRAIDLHDPRASPQLIGLTAQPVYEKDNVEIERAIGELVAMLKVTNIFTVDDQQLLNDGYHVPDAPVVKCYDTFRAGLLGGGEPAAKFDTHDPMVSLLRHVQQWRRAGEMNSPYVRLVELVFHLEGYTCSTPNGPAYRFISELLGVLDNQEELETLKKKTPKIKEWGKCAKESAFPFMEHWYQALHIAAVANIDSIDLALAYLQMSNAFDTTFKEFQGKAPWLQQLVKEFWAFAGRQERPRFKQLCEELAKEVKERGEAFRGLVFVEQRIAAEIIAFYLNNAKDWKLPIGERLRPLAIYSSSTPATASYRMRSRDVGERCDQFRRGWCKLLITTSVLEEGIDIPEANVVFRFDPPTNTSSHAQAKGRGRQEDATATVLVEHRPGFIGKLDDAQEASRRLARAYFQQQGERDPGFWKKRDTQLRQANEEQFYRITQTAEVARKVPKPSHVKRQLLSKIDTNDDDLYVVPLEVVMEMAQPLDVAGTADTPLKYWNEMKLQLKRLPYDITVDEFSLPEDEQGGDEFVAKFRATLEMKGWTPEKRHVNVSATAVRTRGIQLKPRQIARQACINHILVSFNIGLPAWAAGTVYPRPWKG